MRNVINEIPPSCEYIDLPRSDLVKLTRLRIGHCNFTHKHKIDKTDPPYCQCGQMLTVSHLFNGCQFHKNSRNKYQIENIKILSNEKGFENVKNFLKEINLYNYI